MSNDEEKSESINDLFKGLTRQQQHDILMLYHVMLEENETGSGNDTSRAMINELRQKYGIPENLPQNDSN